VATYKILDLVHRERDETVMEVVPASEAEAIASRRYHEEGYYAEVLSPVFSSREEALTYVASLW